MIVFELTMPGVGSWNGKWSGADRRYIRTRRERDVPKSLWGKSFYYRWEDGWEACVTVIKMPAEDAYKLEHISAGFLSYDWMISSLIKRGYIISDSDLERRSKDENWQIE